MITAATVPTPIDSCVWRKLYHTKRQSRAGKSMSVTAGPDEWIHELGIILGP